MLEIYEVIVKPVFPAPLSPVMIIVWLIRVVSKLRYDDSAMANKWGGFSNGYLFLYNFIVLSSYNLSIFLKGFTETNTSPIDV
jgi:hypothetical protein